MDVFWNLLFIQVSELILDVRGPSDACLIYWDLLALIIEELESIIKYTLCYQPAWNSWGTLRKRLTTQGFLLVLPEVANFDDGVAITQLVDAQVLAIELVSISGFYVSSMVLVEVVQLIVHIHWSFHFLLNWSEVNFTKFSFLLKFSLAARIIIILGGALEDLLAEDVENNTDGQEDNTENTEGKHGAHGSGDGTPGGQRLLLELGLLELLNLFTDSLLLVWIDVHIFLGFI